jgi:hypothetical protein
LLACLIYHTLLCRPMAKPQSPRACLPPLDLEKGW